jgi:hypothetical protein
MMKVSRVLIACLVLGQSTAFAQATPEPSASPDAQVAPNPDAKAEASAHFRRGVELFQEEAFRGALVEFERAYAIAPDYRLLYNIGQTKFETQDYIGAIQSYERYLEGGGEDITKERKTVVEGALSALRERVGTVNVLVNRKGAEVFIDDVSVGFTPLAPLRVNVGRHRISAKSTGGATDAEVVSVAGGDTSEVSLMLIEQVAGGPKEKLPMSIVRKTAIGTWAAGAALLGGALATGMLAKGKQDELDELRNTPDVTRTALADKHDEGKMLAVTTDVLIGVGVASAVTGTLLWVFGRKYGEAETKKESAGLRLDVGVGSVGVSGAF